MAGLTWILTFICVAGGHLASASPLLQPPLVVEAGQNVSLTCNLTSVTEVTWYRLRSDRLLPLMMVQSSRLGREDTVDFYSSDSRFYNVGAVKSGTVSLEILQVEEENAGLYVCIGRRAGAAPDIRSIQLAVGGVAGGHLASASPVLQPPLVVEAGQNVSLTCNLTSVTEVTWYRLRSDRLLPLMMVRSSRLGRDTVNFYTSDSRFYNVGAVKSGTVSLEILQVEEEDAGLYVCIGRRAGAAPGSRSIQLVVGGVYEETAGQPCLHLIIFVLLAVLLCVIIIMVGFYLSSGKPAVCCCGSVQSDTGLKVTEDESLHYSSLKHADIALYSTLNHEQQDNWFKRVQTG